MTRKRAIQILELSKEGSIFRKSTIEIALFISGDLDKIPSLKLFRALPVVSPTLLKKESNMPCDEPAIPHKPIAYVSNVNGDYASVVCIDPNRLKIGMVLYDLPHEIHDKNLQRKVISLENELIGMSAEVERLRKLLDEAWGDPL